jgi:NADH/NAD ratio-sensing transcriptional regulator Rex
MLSVRAQYGGYKSINVRHDNSPFSALSKRGYGMSIACLKYDERPCAESTIVKKI